jgi:hypothetical protein
VYPQTVVSVSYKCSYIKIKHIDLVQSGHCHHIKNVNCSHHDIAEIVNYLVLNNKFLHFEVLNVARWLWMSRKNLKISTKHLTCIILIRMKIYKTSTCNDQSFDTSTL